MKAFKVSVMCCFIAITIEVSQSYAIDSSQNQQLRLELLSKIKAQFPVNAYKKKLQKTKQALQAQFKKPDIVERIALERELALLLVKIDNYQKHYDAKVNLLIEAFRSLEHFRGDFSSSEFSSAQTALINGNTEFANQLFSKVNAKYRVTLGGEGIDRAASAVYLQGKIAEEQNDIRKAYRYYRQAVRYDPGDIGYLLAAGRIADSIALYGNSIVFYEAALAIQRKNTGTPPDELRQLLIKLGKVWESKGNKQKADDYIRQSSELSKK